MHVAAQRSDTETMRDELEAGENPNVRDYDGSTPLYLVCLFADKSPKSGDDRVHPAAPRPRGLAKHQKLWGGAFHLNYVRL